MSSNSLGWAMAAKQPPIDPVDRLILFWLGDNADHTECVDLDDETYLGDVQEWTRLSRSEIEDRLVALDAVGLVSITPDARRGWPYGTVRLDVDDQRFDR